MFCTNCGAPLSDNSQFCPSCGKKANPQEPGQIPSPPSPPLQKKFRWKKWLSIFAILALLFFIFVYIASKELTETVEKQLEALRANKITEAYYSYTSKEFQNTTSLDKFREFIQHQPAFHENKTINFYESTFQDNILTLKGILISKDNQKLNIEYKLIDEDGFWKILSIELIDPHISNSSSEQQNQLQMLVKNQLAYLKAEDSHSAYTKTISKQFQKETPFDEFEKFVSTYPFVFNYEHIDFKDFVSSEERPQIVVILHTPSGKYPIEYELEKEHGQWKVWSMRFYLTSDKNSPLNNPAKSLQIVVDKQLSAISKGKLKEAYQLTSKEFQINTPLPLFEKYIKEFPLLSQYESIKYGQSVIEREIGVIEVELHQLNKSMTIDYALKKELGNWKIWGMQINQTVQKGELVTY
ncbi:putative uncharacterized protein [Parachlamydia acanthamoebae UV-7]|jgi:hypothetical protein|uniref:Zinc-ribbon domain-containing protein n=1 Tax=Parachlamydia acanthamoebae (strain UV7) TaxID=765952 RepID=F8KY44_PARAV|nr:DUF4864 domain-containing protein [Parachlamydia acanthamoebae]EFB41989.1 hypothetical protein pah_c016o014 [Parachlamydia acanthamoebae str. Hall's coccus]CCB87683.1 putative uncharacterized protein [Parachlamydia acanthamoebae UV-7]